MTFKAVERILHYLKGIIDYDLLYSFSNEFKLVGYSDSNWVGDLDNRKSTINYTTFTWSSNKKPTMTFTTCEAEYVNVTSCICHVIWLKMLLNELFMP